MKVIAIMGSPHKNGNVSTLMSEVIHGAKVAGHDVKLYNINEMNISGCQGCRKCKDNGIDCVLNDDLKPYWNELHTAGALIVGAPNYCSNICGPMITYMNRHYCILDGEWKCRLHPGIKLVGVFSQRRDDKNTFLDSYNWYLKDFENRDMIRHGMIIHSGIDTASKDTQLMTQAYQLGNSL